MDQFLKSPQFKPEYYLSDCHLLVRAVYYFWFMFSLEFVIRFFLEYFDRLEMLFSPLWPIFWVGHEISQYEAILIGSIFLLGSFQSLIFFKYRWSRVICLLATLIGVSLIFSNGKINHGTHGWILTLFAFCFFPRDWLKSKQEFLKIFYMAQWFVVLLYFLSGLWKIRMILSCYFASDANCAIGSEIMNLTLLKLEVTEGELPRGGQLLLNYPYLGMVGFYAVVLLQLSTLLIIYDRKWINVLGFLLITFHMLTKVTMGPSLYPQVFLLALLLCLSPWSKKIKST